MLISAFAYSQKNEIDFVDKYIAKYRQNELKYKQKANKAIDDYNKRHPESAVNKDSVEYLVIPCLLMKRDKKLYEKIDTFNLLKYYDISSMYFNEVLVHQGDSLIGVINDGMRDADPQKLLEDFSRFSVRNGYYDRFKRIYDFGTEYVFAVQNQGYFLVKDSRLYVSGRQYYSIEEYVNLFKTDIYDFLFRYFPRSKPIIAY